MRGVSDSFVGEGREEIAADVIVGQLVCRRKGPWEKGAGEEDDGAAHGG